MTYYVIKVREEGESEWELFILNPDDQEIYESDILIGEVLPLYTLKLHAQIGAEELTELYPIHEFKVEPVTL
jgi:hypothetical protein